MSIGLTIYLIAMLKPQDTSGKLVLLNGLFNSPVHADQVTRQEGFGCNFPINTGQGRSRVCGLTSYRADLAASAAKQDANQSLPEIRRKFHDGVTELGNTKPPEVQSNSVVIMAIVLAARARKNPTAASDRVWFNESIEIEV
jgi:hypothetical protein